VGIIKLEEKIRMPKASIHVLLVSAQAAPNLLAALDPDLKPTEAVLMVSKKMLARAASLEKVLKEAGVKTNCVSLDDEHDFAKLQAALLDVATGRERQSIALNVTGGTKLMALAAQSVALAAGWGVFYVDVDTDEVIWLGDQPQRRKLFEQLRLRQYLGGYGFSLHEGIQRAQPSEPHADLLKTLVTQVGSLEIPLGQLNWLGQESEDKRTLQVGLSDRQMDSRGLEALLRHFQDAGVLVVEGDKVRFTSEPDRAFAKGGWLEQYVFQTLSNIGGELGVRDKAVNLTVTDNDKVKNELDVAFMARNRLFVIECKTARMDKPEAPKANDTLFKLSEICRRVGGLGTRCMLASYRPLRDEEKRLAKALGVEVVSGADLARLREKLKVWVRS
jgi:Domain of unknown function (DUF1887)